MNTASVKTTVHAADLREPGAAIAAAIAAFGRFDPPVNNAGATGRAEFFNLIEEDRQDGFALKFHGYVRLTRAAWPHPRKTSGSTVNIVNTGSRSGSAEFTIGGSINVAVPHFTGAMAAIGIRQRVRVDAINPGPIGTGRFIRNAERTVRHRSITRERAIKHFVVSHGTKRGGRSDEIGTLTACLGKRRIHTGCIIAIDGGATL